MRVLVLIACLATAPLAQAADRDDDSVDQTVGSSRIRAGASVQLTEPVVGNVYLAGGDVTVAAPVTGSAYISGGHVDVQDSIGKGLYAAGGSLLVDATVGHGAHLAGGSVEVARTAKLKGKVWLAGSSVTMDGGVDGALTMMGADVTLNGTVDGDAEIAAERIEIGPQAQVTGHLRYRSAREPTIAASANVAGGIEALPEHRGRWFWHEGPHRFFRSAGTGLSFGSALVLGVLLLVIAPAYLAATSRVVRAEWPTAAGVGAAVLVGVPIGIVFLFITIIGIPAGLLALAVYALVLLLGYIVGAVAVGDLALARVAQARADVLGWRLLALIATLAAFGILRHVPLLGPLGVFLVFLCGVGALTLRIFGHGRSVTPAT
jgi:hypothetical protein